MANELTLQQAKAAAMLLSYKLTLQTRNARVRAALTAGLSKQQVHVFSGIARTTIDAILAQAEEAGP